MSDWESEFEPPKITSTPKKMSTTEQLAFQNKLHFRKNAIDINRFPKWKSKSVAAKEEIIVISSDESDSSEDDGEKKSASEVSSESGSNQEEDEKRRTQKDVESGSESSSEGSRSEHGDDAKLNRTNYVPTKRTARILDDHVDDAFDLPKLSEDDEVYFASVACKLSLDRRQRIRLHCGDCVVEFDKHDKENLCLLGMMGAGCGVKHVHTAGGITVAVAESEENESD